MNGFRKWLSDVLFIAAELVCRLAEWVEPDANAYRCTDFDGDA